MSPALFLAIVSVALVFRAEESERSVDSVRKKSYLGSALFPLLGGVPAGLRLFPTLFLPRQHSRIGAAAPMEYDKLRLLPAYKPPRAG